MTPKERSELEQEIAMGYLDDMLEDEEYCSRCGSELPDDDVCEDPACVEKMLADARESCPEWARPAPFGSDLGDAERFRVPF